MVLNHPPRGRSKLDRCTTSRASGADETEKPPATAACLLPTVRLVSPSTLPGGLLGTVTACGWRAPPRPLGWRRDAQSAGSGDGGVAQGVVGAHIGPAQGGQFAPARRSDAGGALGGANCSAVL